MALGARVVGADHTRSPAGARRDVRRPFAGADARGHSIGPGQPDERTRPSASKGSPSRLPRTPCVPCRHRGGSFLTEHVATGRISATRHYAAERSAWALQGCRPPRGGHIWRDRRTL